MSVILQKCFCFPYINSDWLTDNTETTLTTLSLMVWKVLAWNILSKMKLHKLPRLCTHNVLTVERFKQFPNFPSAANMFCNGF